ncbi:hypothetical protein [Actinoallomurus sp. CA-142502]
MATGRTDDLDGDRPAVRRRAEEDLPHAAFAQPGDHLVASDVAGIGRVR